MRRGGGGQRKARENEEANVHRKAMEALQRLKELSLNSHRAARTKKQFQAGLIVVSIHHSTLGIDEARARVSHPLRPRSFSCSLAVRASARV